MSELFAVIMAGGSGTRFWPVSRRRRPKQLLPIGGDLPLVQRTSERLRPLIPPERQLIVTSERYADAVRDMLPDVPPEQVLGEPVGRDTAPCIGLASRVVAQLDPEATVVAMPSDHIIRPEDTFRERLRTAGHALAARPEALLVFGIQPDRPATGYGYLRQGAALDAYDGHTVFALDGFVEKPDAERAAAMLAEGGYLWNAGLFAFRPPALDAAFRRHLPALVEPLGRMARAFGREEFDRVLSREFTNLSAISIDYGVMEKVDGALLLPLPLHWDDVGAWESLRALHDADAAGNVAVGDTLLDGASECVVMARDGVVAVRGVSGLIVVHTPDATLVCRRDDEQGVKAIVEALTERGLEKYL